MRSDHFFKNMNRLHRMVRAITFGKVGWTAANMPVLELTTTGRTSGKPRTVLLTAPVTVDDAFVIVASKGGHPTHPAWYLNLLDDPNVTVTTEDGSRQMVARLIEGDERTQLWPKITRAAENYADYQTKTERQIPIVALDPK